MYLKSIYHGLLQETPVYISCAYVCYMCFVYLNLYLFFWYSVYVYINETGLIKETITNNLGSPRPATHTIDIVHNLFL